MEIDNYLIKIKLKNIERKIEDSKFKGRFKYVVGEDKIVFYLDNLPITTKSIDDFFDAKMEVVDEVYADICKLDSVETLFDFIETYCCISKTKLPPNKRVDRHTFIKTYQKFALNKYGKNKVVGTNRITYLLQLYFKEKPLKCNGKYYFSFISFSNKILELDNQLEIIFDSRYTVNDNSLVDFINQFCVVSDNINPSERIARTDFRKAYKLFVKNYSNRCEMEKNNFNDILKSVYNETFIKSNGIFYMSKIKFKNLTK